MPRGFLVKRSRRPTPISYRTRCCCYPEAAVAQGGEPGPGPPPHLPPPPPAHHLPSRRPGLAPEPPDAAPLSVPAVPRFGTPEGPSSPAPLHSPARAVSEERGPLVLGGSPASAESFPAPEPLLLGPVGGESLKLWAAAAAAIAPPPPRPPLPPRGPPAAAAAAPSPAPGTGAKRPPQGRKVKAARKLHFEDEVTTSPVLGLRIKEGPPEPASTGATAGTAATQPPPPPQQQQPRPAGTAGGGRAAGGQAPLLGEFICQLCKEPYPDPLSLAQHKCSRIVRVEYRCPECDKLFSCPANLASHRRWHKPRPPSGPAAAKGKVAAEEPVKAAAAAGGGGGGGGGSSSSSSERDTPSPGSGAEPEPAGAEEFPCPRCAKRFRRPSALRKHLPTHPEPLDGLAQAQQQQQHPGLLPEASAASSHSPLAMPGECHPCPVCSETFSSKSGQERHLRLLHAAQAFPCKYCPATFYSSPGLTRHINKCHPSENRQVVLLQVPVRPAC